MKPVSSLPDQAVRLLEKYDRWLAFLVACQLTVRHYDQQLIRIKRYYPHLADLTSHLRTRMHDRSAFFESLATLLSSYVNQLRADLTNADLIQRLTQAIPFIELLINQLTVSFAEIEESYRTLPATPNSRRF